MSELPVAVILRWSGARARADGTLMGLVQNQLYRDIAPQSSASRPFLIHSVDNPSDLRVVGAVRVWSNVMLLIKAVDRPANYAALAAIMAQADSLFDNPAAMSFEGSYINSCLRESTFDYIDDTQYQHVGANYRVEVTIP